MMTTLLPAAISNSFNAPLDQRLYVYRDPSVLVSPISLTSAGSWTRVLPHRQILSSPRIPTTPASVNRNNENATPYGSLDAVTKGTSKNMARTSVQKASRLNHNSISHTVPGSCQHQSSGSSLPSFQARQQKLVQFSRSPRHGFHNDTPTRAKQKGGTIGLTCDRLKCTPDSSAAGQTNEPLEPFPVLSYESKPYYIGGSIEASQDHHPGSNEERNAENIGQHIHTHHRQRQSDASSGFVHTIKTASMSNASLSIVPRSFRMGRSSESHGYFKAYSRHSLDSDRPVTGSSLDEAAFRRGLKRKQIINELIMTEESYVADLKALLYLYSTLLASATTISGCMRTAIQRNVTELLHVHETLLDRLHQATFRAAARKWAATERPARLELMHHIRWKNIRGGIGCGLERKHCRIRSSIDSAEVAKAHIVIGAAEPADIFDLAEVFESVLTQLFVYEEYCANHELIAHELQKHMPALWSAYESGMESLNKSLVALSRRAHQDRRGLTVGDLLIKPVQRICKYPLLLEDLIRNTPVADGPAAHKALDSVLVQFHGIVQTVNLATDNHITRAQIQRKWLLQDKLFLHEALLSQAQFRALGTIQLCGVLCLTYQDAVSDIQGSYALCALFDNHFLVALPTIRSTKLELVAIISLSDLRIESATDGKGLQSLSSLHTWKVVFTAESDLYEILLSACSKEEEEQWTQGLRGHFRPMEVLQISTMFDQSRICKNVKSLGTTFRPFTPLSQQSPGQYDTTVTSNTDSCQVILRNTHNPQDWQEFRNVTSSVVNRSQPQHVAKRVVVLAPKRAERTRLENSMSDVYTKDRLPFPGIISSKGSRIIRASAGSLVRKLSFASMQASFSRRSASLSSKKSFHTVHAVSRTPPTFSVRKRSLDTNTPNRHSKPKDLPELDTMDSVIERMIGIGATRKRLSFSHGDKLVRKNTKSSRSRRTSACQIGPEDPAMIFYKDDNHVQAIEREIEETDEKEKQVVIEDCLIGSKKKRWSNPIAKLKGLGSDGIKNMLYSSK